MSRPRRSDQGTRRDPITAPPSPTARAGTVGTATHQTTPPGVDEDPATFFSVVVPTYHRPRRLARLLGSLAQLRYPSTRFEVVVVDDGSPEPVEPHVAPFRRTLELVVARQDNSGPAAARNLGVRLAGGGSIALIDDDCTADPDWLTAFHGSVTTWPTALHGGRVVNALTGNPYATANQLLLDFLYRHYAAGARLGGFFTTNNLCVPRSGFEELGGFDSRLRFGEDRDFCYRWALRDNQFRFARRAVVHHAHAVDLVGLLRLHFWYGGGSYELRRKVAARGLPPVETSPLSVYLGLLLAGVRHRPGLAGLRLSALLLAMQGASAVGMLRRAIIRAPRSASVRRRGPSFE